MLRASHLEARDGDLDAADHEDGEEQQQQEEDEGDPGDHLPHLLVFGDRVQLVWQVCLLPGVGDKLPAQKRVSHLLPNATALQPTSLMCA